MGDFERDTHVEPAEAGGGRYPAVLSEDWEIWGPNGGYLASIALRAAGREAVIQRPVAFAGHFLTVARFAGIDAEVELVRRGRSSESLRVTLTQERRPIFTALLRTAAEVPGLEHDVARAPDVPPPDALEPVVWQGTYPFWSNFDVRWVKPSADDRNDDEPRAHEPHWLSWQRFHPRATFDDPFTDAARYLLLIDTLTWPAASLPHPNGAFRAPNLDVVAWFHRADPDGDWLLVEQHCHVAEGGLMGTHGRIWSRDGRLLASGGAQLFCVPSPPQP